MTVKVATVATGLALAVSMLSFAPMAQAALTSSQVQAILSLLTSFGADSATIANVNASLTGGTPSTPSTPSSSCSFSRSLTVGSQGADVTCLQQALINAGYSVPAGATGYFGTQTRTAVASWQSSKNIAPAVGYFGPISRAAFNLGGGTPGVPGVPGVPITGNGLRVTLASDSPNNIALTQLQSAGELARYTFSNSTGSDIKVTNLSLKRIGVSTDSALSNVYLFDGERRLTDPAGISNSTFSFNDTSGLFTVAAGSAKTISVRADIATGASGQQIGVQLLSVGSSGTLDSSVSFPVNGYTQTVSSATLATASLSTVTPTGGTFAPGVDTTVFQSTITVNTRAVLLKAVTFENRGSTGDADFQNLKLLVRGTQVGSTVSKTTDDKVTFDFSASPLRLETGASEIRLTADIVGGSGETFDFQLRRAVDIRLVDVDLGGGITPTGVFAAVTVNNVDGVALSVSRAANSPTSNVAIDATNVKWGSFEFRATGDDLKIEQIIVDATMSAGTDLDNGKVFLNGVQIGSTQDISEGDSTIFTFGSQMILKRGTTAVVDVYSDAKQADGTSLTTGTTVAVSVRVAIADTEGVQSGDRIGAAIALVPGNTITVSSSSLTASKVGSYSNQSVVAGTNNFKLGSFTLSTGSTEGVNVNTIVVGFASAVTSTMTDLKLVDNATGTQIGSTKSSVSQTNSFSVSGVNIAASGSRTVDVYANITSSANIGPVPATTVTASTGGIGSVTGTSVNVVTVPTLQTMSVVSTGTLTTAVNTGGTPTDAIVVGGTNMVKIGSFNFLATNSGYTVNKVLVKVPASSASAVSLITLKNASTGTTLASQGFTLGASGALTHSTSAFTGLGFVIPAGTSNALDVYVDVALITSNNANLSGQSISVVLDGNEGFEATDGSNLTILLTNSADLSSDGTNIGVALIRKAAPVLASATLPTSNLTGATVIGKFTITSSATGDNGTDWGKMAFTISKSASVLIGATTTIALYDVTGGAHTLVAGSFATSTASTVTQTQMFSTETSGLVDFRPTIVQNVQKGQTKTYQLETVISGTLVSGNSLQLSLTNPSTGSAAAGNLATVAGTQGTALSASFPSFVWSDWSDVTNHFTAPTTATDWINDYLVKSLPITTIGNLSMP